MKEEMKAVKDDEVKGTVAGQPASKGAEHVDVVEEDVVDDLKNGRILGGLEVPTELLETILACLQLDTILKASKVCVAWNEIVRSPVLWKRYYKRNRVIHTCWTHVHEHIGGRPDEWAVHFAVSKYDVFHRNLLVNPFGVEGIDGMKGWTVLSGHERTEYEQYEDWDGPNPNGWEVIDVPKERIAGFPGGLGPSKCFVTDAFSCSKEQQIDLWALGFTPAVMRACVPFTISWGEYVGTPRQHGAFHEMSIRLLDQTMEDISYSLLTLMNNAKNIQAGSPFTKYEDFYVVQGQDAYEVIDKLRYICFYHGGMAKDVLRGHNGPHIYSPRVSIDLGAADIS